MRNTTLVIGCLLLLKSQFSYGQQTINYELIPTNVEILSPPSATGGEYFGPNYNLYSKPLIAQPFASNAACYGNASTIYSPAGSINNVFFGGDLPSIHGYYDVSSMIATKKTFTKSDFPILLESNFFSRENTAGYNEFYFWIGNANAPYYGASTTVLPFDYESKEGLLVGCVPSRNIAFNGFDNEKTGITLFDLNNNLFKIQKWSNHKLLLDIINGKLAIIGYWVDNICSFNAFQNGYEYVNETPWLDNLRLGVCIDDLGKDFNIVTNYQYYNLTLPDKVCQGNCVEYKFEPNDLLCENFINLNWQFQGASITNSSLLKVEEVCYNTPGLFDFSLAIENTVVHQGKIEVIAKKESALNFELCHGNTLKVGEIIYDKAGSYAQNFTTAEGCDSILRIEIAEIPPLQTDLTFNLCDDEEVIIAGESYNLPGEYIKSLIATNGCDSILNIKINKNNSVESVLSYNLCGVTSIVVNGLAYTSPGQYLQVLSTTSGCDSTLVINIAPCQEVLHYDFEDCNAMSPQQSMNYVEFKPDYGTLPVCGNLLASNIFRDNPAMNKHSCTEGYNGGIAMCVSSLNSCNFSENTESDIVFTIELSPNGIEKMALDQISFYQKAPTNYSWIAGASGLNNYPTKYAIRILKENIEVYRNLDIATSLTWRQDWIDLTGNPAFIVDKKTTFRIELTPYCLVGNGAVVAAWDIDELSVYTSCPDSGNRIIGGQIEEYSESFQEIEVQRWDGNIKTISKVNSQGNFLFKNNKPDKEYIITSFYDKDHIKGINTLDLVLIQRHILGIEKFSEPLQYIAADVNKDGKITVSDLVELRKLLIGYQAKFLFNTSYRCIDKQSIGAGEGCATCRDYISLPASAINAENLIFIPVKIGDVDGQLHREKVKEKTRPAVNK